MHTAEIKETSIWQLYEKGRNYHRRVNIYSDTDRNHRFYNGDQWEGAKLGGIEKIQKNIIRPIVKYKLAVIHDNLYEIVFSSLNFDNPAFRDTADRICTLLNNYAARIWERDKMDYKGRRITKDAAINDEGLIYVYFDTEKGLPVNEVVDKCDVYYGNENDDDIQSQPYILIRKRLPESNALELALSLGMSEELADMIVGDNDNFEEAGEAAKDELDDMVTVVYKFYKENGRVHFSVATRYVDIAEDHDTGRSLYPLAHFIWEEKKGSARGEGEVRQLIPNQIEINRTETRRAYIVKTQCFPQKVVLRQAIGNKAALESVGTTIEVEGQTVDDVRKIITTLPPAQMSPDVVKLQEDLIRYTRDLAGAGDSATGNVNPESSSGRAILAVQQASQAPVTEQKEGYKAFLEDVARIWLETLVVNAGDGISLEDTVRDPNTGRERTVLVNIPRVSLERLRTSVKIDITPKSPYDKFAQDQTIENLLVQGFFRPDRVGELRTWAEALDDNSTAPKRRILEICDKIEENQRRIAQIEANTQIMQQRAEQFLAQDPDAQGAQLAHAAVAQTAPARQPR